MPILGVALALAFLLAVVLRVLGQVDGSWVIRVVLPLALGVCSAVLGVCSRARFFKPGWAHPALSALVVLCCANLAYRYIWGGISYENLSFVLILLGIGGIYTRWSWFGATFAAVSAIWAFTLFHLPHSVSVPTELLEWLVSTLILCLLFFLNRRRAFEAFYAQSRRLLEVNELKNAFVNDLVHEMRNPLVALRGFAELLEDGVGGTLSDEQQGFVAQIQANAERQERRLDELLDTARIESGQFTLGCRQIDWGTTLGQFVGELASGARSRGVSLDFEGPRPDVVAFVDPERIAQVLTNFVSNALKFSPAGSTIRIRASASERALGFSVQDEGPGIAPADQARLFQRFSQLEAGRSRGGSGLGLSISKALVEAHGGRLGVESAPGQGARFWVELPRAPKA